MSSSKKKSKTNWVPVKSENLPKSYPIPEDTKIIAFCSRCKRIIFSDKYEITTSSLLGSGGGVGGITKNYSSSYPIAHEIKCPNGTDSHYCRIEYTL